MSIEFQWKYTVPKNLEAFAVTGAYRLLVTYNMAEGWDWKVYAADKSTNHSLVARGDCTEEHIAQKMAETMANLRVEDVRCLHKFVDSKNCLHCGWIPPRRFG
jgi:hypothetical protein